MATWRENTPRVGVYDSADEGVAVAIYGAGGSGKTRFAFRCLTTNTSRTRMVAFDPEGDVERYLDSIAIAPPRSADRIPPGRVACISDASEFLAYTDGIRDTLIYLDESNVLLSQAMLVSSDQRPGTLLRTCRNRGNELIFSTQLPQLIGPYARTRADWTYALQARTSDAVAALGLVADAWLWEECESLPKHEALVYGPERQHTKAPLARVDLRRDPIPHRMSAADRALFVRTQ